MIRAVLRLLFGGRPTPAELRRRADRHRNRAFAHLDRSKAERAEARRLDEAADRIEFGPNVRLPSAFMPRAGEGDQSNGQPP